MQTNARLLHAQLRYSSTSLSQKNLHEQSLETKLGKHNHLYSFWRDHNKLENYTHKNQQLLVTMYYVLIRYTKQYSNLSHRDWLFRRFAVYYYEVDNNIHFTLCSNSLLV